MTKATPEEHPAILLRHGADGTIRSYNSCPRQHRREFTDMALTPSTMPELGIPAPAFSLPDIDGRTVSLDDFRAEPALLVVFWCNHCPYVLHIREGFTAFARDYQPQGLGIVAISANDVTTHPDDGPEFMQAEADQHDFTFPYLYDENQRIAQSYKAACTPDFFLYDGQRDKGQRALVYRGQFDAARPGNNTPVTGQDLRRAVDALLAGQPVPDNQQPSIGCNIKWKPGNEPSYP
jgi:peroxiredoxin